MHVLHEILYFMRNVLMKKHSFITFPFEKVPIRFPIKFHIFKKQKAKFIGYDGKS